MQLVQLWIAVAVSLKHIHEALVQLCGEGE